MPAFGEQGVYQGVLQGRGRGRLSSLPCAVGEQGFTRAQGEVRQEGWELWGHTACGLEGRTSSLPCAVGEEGVTKGCVWGGGRLVLGVYRKRRSREGASSCW